MAVTIEGVELRFNRGSGALGWASDWGRVHVLADQGHLRRSHGGPGTYGHVDYFLVRSGDMGRQGGA
jgi:hypothetical protein